MPVPRRMTQYVTICLLLLFPKCALGGVMKEYFFCRKDMSERQLLPEERLKLIDTAVGYLNSVDDKNITKRPPSFHAYGQTWEMMWYKDLFGIHLKESTPKKKCCLHVLVSSLEEEILVWYTYPDMKRMTAGEKEKKPYPTSSDIRLNPGTNDVYFLDYDGSCYITPIRLSGAISSHTPMHTTNLVPESEAIKIRFVRNVTILMTKDNIYKVYKNFRTERIVRVKNSRLLQVDTNDEIWWTENRFGTFTICRFGLHDPRTKRTFYKGHLPGRMESFMPVTVNKRTCVYMCMPVLTRLCEKDDSSLMKTDSEKYPDTKCQDMSAEGDLLFVLHVTRPIVKVIRLNSLEQVKTLNFVPFKEQGSMLIQVVMKDPI